MVEEILVDNFIGFGLASLVGVLGYLYGRIRTNSKGLDAIRNDHKILSDRLRGDSEDDTRPGFLLQTETRFDELFERLDEMEEERKSEHHDVERRLAAIAERVNARHPDGATDLSELSVQRMGPDPAPDARDDTPGDSEGAYGRRHGRDGID